MLLYTLPPCEDARCGIGHPDWIETASGSIFVTETDTVNSRVHPLPRGWLERLWKQDTIAEVASAGKIFDKRFGRKEAMFAGGNDTTTIAAPP